jgi:hypothetical protein
LFSLESLLSGRFLDKLLPKYASVYA